MISVHTDQENFNSSNRSYDSTAVVATVVIVLLAVMIISVSVFYLCFKKKKVKGTDMTQ